MLDSISIGNPPNYYIVYTTETSYILNLVEENKPLLTVLRITFLQMFLKALLSSKYILGKKESTVMGKSMVFCESMRRKFYET